MNKLRHDALKAAIPIPDPKVRLNEPLNLWQLGIIMIIYLSGVSISILAFIGEVLKRREINLNTGSATDHAANEQIPMSFIK